MDIKKVTPIEGLTKAFDNQLKISKSQVEGRIVKKVNNIHSDDLHCFVPGFDHGYLTGSKDGWIKSWGPDLTARWQTSPSFMSKKRDYRHWITSLHPFESGFYAGSRDGVLSVFDKDGRLLRSKKVTPLKEHFSKQRNQNRVLAIADLHDSKHLIVGLPTEVQVWNKQNFRHFYSQTISQNDWIYTISHLAHNKYLFVVGSDLEIRENRKTAEGKWTFSLTEKLHTEIQTEINRLGGKTLQRPLISSVDYLNSQKLVTTDFSGRVKVFDIENKRMLSSRKVHTGRAWSVKVKNEYTFATSADDGFVKLWDTRQAGPVAALGKHDGRVSNLMINNNEVIATSCPNNVFKSTQKACFTVWNLYKR